MFDVAIVGAGPAGVHAAIGCARAGLRVVLIEKRTDISKITRYCSEHLILDENYNGDTLIVEPGLPPRGQHRIVPPNKKNKIKSSRFGWEIEYHGPLCPCLDKYYYSADLAHNAHFAWADGRPLAWKYDKGGLVQQLLDQALALGIEYMSGTTCYEARDSRNGEGVHLKCVSRGKRCIVRAKKLLAADGASAQVAQSMGINADRMYFTQAPVVALYMSGVKNYNRNHWVGYWGLCYGSHYAPLIGTGPHEHFDWADLIVIGTDKQKPLELFEYFTKKSPVAWMFADAKVEKMHSCTTKAFAPMKKPYQGNCLVIGDAAAFVEVQAQGALNCGWCAADAVVKELQGQAGFEEYTRTWLETFEFNDDGMMQVTTGYALIPYYTDEQVSYLFSLLDNVTLDGSWSQYQSPRLIWGEIHKNDERIQKERPDIWEKLQKQQSRTLGS
jgi:digeranylgeranylglycerophospholipid reductase